MVEKIGPYRVYERLGVGGMGEVYKAYDDRLDRWVAIKRIRPDREDADDNRERFKREARATARLNHPSIVHLYGIFQDGDSDCIVMEYVEGETLDKKLVDGPLDPLESANLGHEIASGLAEAHSNGILHRDLKAENIIITPKGRSKILDFGLAKPILAGELDPVLTGKGQLVGTSRAMSPEYVGGEDIDHRSDLFSLGVLIYECLTGQSPFKAHNTLATLKQVMLHKQTPIRELNPNVPPDLSKLIDRLLAKEPSDRPQNAQDVALAFGKLCGQMSSSTHDRPTGSFLDSTSSVVKKQAAKAFAASETVLDLRPPRRWMTGLVVLGVLLVGAFFLGRYLNRPPEVEPLPEGEQIRVVLGDFVNQTQEPVFDDSLHQAVRVDLEQSRAVRTMAPSLVRDTLLRMQQPANVSIDRDVAVEIARREGADRVVLGEIQKFGETYSLVIQVVAPETDVTTFSASESANSHSDILAAIQKLTTATRRHLGESADQISESTSALEKVTTANFEALRAYTLGQERMTRHQFREAVAFFQRAVELDPSFGMAHAKLAVAFSNSGDQERAVAQALQAQRYSDRLTEKERFYVDGWVARWQETPQDVLDIWSLFSDLYPEEHASHFNLGLSYWYYLNDFENAVKSFDLAAKTASTEAEVELSAWCLGLSRLALGAIDEAAQPLRKGGTNGIAGLVFIDAITGRWQEASQRAEGLANPDTRLLVQSVLLGVQGDLQEVLGRLEDGREHLKDSPFVSSRMHAVLTELFLASQVDDPQRLTATMGRMNGVLAETDLYDRHPDDRSAPMVAQAIKVLARHGDVDAATSLRQLLGLPPRHTPAITLSLIEIADAEIALARGELGAAQRSVDRALDLVPSIQAHDTRAAIQDRLGNDAEAARSYGWITARPGLAFVECYMSCFSASSVATTWSLAWLRRGQVLEEAEPQEAAASYSRFLDLWGQSKSPEVRFARDRIVALAE